MAEGSTEEVWHGEICEACKQSTGPCYLAEHGDRKRLLCENCAPDPQKGEFFLLPGAKEAHLCEVMNVRDGLVFWESLDDENVFGDAEISDFQVNVLGKWSYT